MELREKLGHRGSGTGSEAELLLLSDLIDAWLRKVKLFVPQCLLV